MTRPHGMTRYRRGPDENGNPGKGCRCAVCRGKVNGYDNHRRRMVAYGRWEYPEDATGTRRRLQALMCCGWSLSVQAAKLGCSRQELRLKLHERRSVSAATARAVRVLYRELCTQSPPEGTRDEKSAATRARGYARKHGFVPVGAWEDDPGPHCINDPAAVPVPGWERAEVQTPSGSASVAAVIRRAREAAGLSRPRLAVVLGVSAQAVKHWEDGVRTPGPESWEQLELALGPLGIVRKPARRTGDGDGGREGEEAA